MKFTLPIGHQVRFGDLLDRKLVRPALTFDLDEAALGPADRPREIAPPLDPLRQLDPRGLPRKSCKVSLSTEGPIKPWRAHFELVCMRHDIGAVERRRYISAHALTVRVRN